MKKHCGSGNGIDRGDRADRGQIAAVMAAVIALVLVTVIAVALVGQAIVARTSATVAADAVALAEAGGNASAASAVSEFYAARGVEVEAAAGIASAVADQGLAQSRAKVQVVGPAPVVLAILARAEQLVGDDLQVLAAHGFRVTLSAESAERFGPVSGGLGMCQVEPVTFVRC